MLETIPVPAQSKFGAAVARRLNASRPIAPAGSLAMSGPTGTGFAPLPANLRDRRGGSSVQPRQFDIRARVEARGEDETKEYRLVVEFYNSTDDAVSLSGKAVLYSGGQQTLSNGWNILYTSSWSSLDINESKQYYLNVWIGAELDADGQWSDFSANDTRWWISETQTSHVHSIRANMALFRHGYLLGSVVANNSSAVVTQRFDGPLIFLDFVELGRSGGGSGPDVDGTNYPMPFQYKRTVTEDQETGETTSSWDIVNNVFYWDGVLKSVTPDPFTPPATCTVYLCCTQDAPSSSGEAEWQFAIATSPAQAPSGGRAVNYKLYDIADNKVTMDYRTTFLELKSPHKVAKFVVERYDGEDGNIELDATIEGNTVVKVSGDENNYARLYASSNSAAAKGLHVNSESSQARLLANSTSAYLSLSGTGSSYVSIKCGRKSVLIDPSKFENGNTAEFHKLTVKHADDTPDDEYYVIADNDITINEGAADDRLTGVELELNGDTNLRLKLTFTDKDGNTRYEYSTGITLKQVDVVSDVIWNSPTLSKSGKKVTVIEEKSTGDQNLFTAVAHSTHTNL